MGRLAELLDSYEGAGLQLLSVVMDVHSWDSKTAEDARHYISATDAEGYPHLIVTPELTEGLAYIPSSHIYDSSGTLIAKLTGEHSTQDWINIIETLMAKL